MAGWEDGGDAAGGGKYTQNDDDDGRWQRNWYVLRCVVRAALVSSIVLLGWIIEWWQNGAPYHPFGYHHTAVSTAGPVEGWICESIHGIW